MMFEIVIELLRFSKSILISKSINNIAIIIESSVLYLNINSFISVYHLVQYLAFR